MNRKQLIMVTISALVLSFLAYLFFNQAGQAIQKMLYAKSSTSQAAFLELFKYLFAFMIFGGVCWAIIKRYTSQ